MKNFEIKTDIAKANSEIFTMRDANMNTWMKKVLHYRKTTMDNPFDSAQQAEIESQQLDPEAFLNIHTSLTDAFVGLMASNKNSLTAIPKQGDIKKAYLYQVILADIMFKSKWPTHHRLILNDQAQSGIGFSLVDTPDPWSPNIYNTAVKYLDFENCRWSFSHDDPFMEDLDDFIFYTNMSVKSAITKAGIPYDEKMFKDMYETACLLPESLKEAPTIKDWSQSNTAPTENQIVPWIQLYRKEPKGYLELIRYNQDKTKIASSKRVEFSGDANPKDFLLSYFIESGSSKEDAQYAIDVTYGREGGIKPLKVDRVIKQISIGGLDVGAEVLPTSKYPVTPFKFKQVKGAAPIGMVQAFDGAARMINQAFYIEFLTGTANAGLHYEYPNGMFDDKEFKKEAQKLMGIFKSNPQPLGNGQVSELNVIGGKSNPSTMMNMIQFLIGFIENQTGISDIVSGTYSGTPPSGDMAETLQKYSGLRFRPFAEDNQMALAHMGSVMLDFAKARTDKDAIARVFESDDEAIELMKENLGAEDTGFRSKDGVPLIEIKLNKDDGDKLVNDVQNTSEDFDVVIVAAPFTETNRRAAIAALDLANQQDPTTIVPTIGEKLELMEIPQAKRIAKKLDNTNQIMEENNNLKEQIKTKDAVVKNLSDQLIRARTTTQVTKEAVPVKSAFESLLNEVNGMIQAGTIDPAVAADATEKINAAMEDLEKLTNPQGGNDGNQN